MIRIIHSCSSAVHCILIALSIGTYSALLPTNRERAELFHLDGQYSLLHFPNGKLIEKHIYRLNTQLTFLHGGSSFYLIVTDFRKISGWTCGLLIVSFHMLFRERIHE